VRTGGEERGHFGRSFLGGGGEGQEMKDEGEAQSAHSLAQVNNACTKIGA